MAVARFLVVTVVSGMAVIGSWLINVLGGLPH